MGPGPSVGIGRAPRSLGRLPTAAPGSRRHPTTNRFLRPRSRIESGGGARARGPTATRRSRRALRPVGVTGGDAPSPPPAPLRATTPHTPGEEDHWAFFLSFLFRPIHPDRRRVLLLPGHQGTGAAPHTVLVHL